MSQGTENLLNLAAELRTTAPRIREWYDTHHASELMLRAAEALERLAELEPDIDVERAEE